MELAPAGRASYSRRGKPVPELTSVRTEVTSETAKERRIVKTRMLKLGHELGLDSPDPVKNVSTVWRTLAAFGIAVTGVTRSGREGTITPDAWRDRLGEFDWIVLAAPSTGDTKALIAAAELSAMKSSAWIVNIARGDMIDDDALVAALNAGTIAGAFLDPTNPEPLPPDHPLWTAPNTMITMHLSGQSQTKMFPRAAALFLRNLAAYRAGEPMENVADLEAGY